MAKNQRIKVGQIGLGYWGLNLLRNLVHSGRCEVMGAMDSSPQARDKVKRLYPHIPIYAAPEDFLAAAKPDAMIVSTPPEDHKSSAMRFLEAGAHVLVEKPLAKTVADCDSILAAANRVKKVVMVDHTFVYHPAVTHLAREIKSGALGKILYFDSVRANFGKFQATNVLWDLGPHDLSILDFFLDGRMPEQVSAVAAAHLGMQVDDLCYVTLKYSDGFLAHLHLNWMSPVKIRTIMVGGDRRMAVYDDNLPTEKIKVYDKEIDVLNRDPNELRVRYRVGDMVAPAIPDSEALAQMIGHFFDSIEANTSPISDGAAGRRVVAILEAASTSALAGGKPVKLE